MPKCTKNAGMRMPKKVLNSLGKWVNSKFAGMRVRSGTCVSDFEWLGIHRPNKQTHTSPVKRTKHNSGDTNPTRIRHAATKRFHAMNRAGDCNATGL